MAATQASVGFERSMTSTIKVAFWNLGWQESMLLGKHRRSHLKKLHDVAKLWHKHDLDGVMLCELGEHNKGFSTDDQTEIAECILDNIRRCTRYINRGHEQYDKATEPVLRSRWQGSYFAVWDERRLTIDGDPNIVYFRGDDYRHYVTLVVRKPSHFPGRQFQSVLLVNAHAPDGKHRLTDPMRKDIITSVRAEAQRLTDGRFICGGDLNTDPAMISRFHPDLQIVTSKPLPSQRGDCACVGGLMAFQSESCVGKSYQSTLSASDTHDAVVVEVTTYASRCYALESSSIGFLSSSIAEYAGRQHPETPCNVLPRKSPSGDSPMEPIPAVEASTVTGADTVAGSGMYGADDWVAGSTLPAGAIEPTIGHIAGGDVNDTTGLHGDAYTLRIHETQQREADLIAKQMQRKQACIAKARAAIQTDATERASASTDSPPPRILVNDFLICTFPSIDSVVAGGDPIVAPSSREETPLISGHHPAERSPIGRSNSYPENTPVTTASSTHCPDASRPWLTLHNSAGVVQYLIHPHVSKGSPYTVHRPDDKPSWMWIRGTIQPISQAAQNAFRVFHADTLSVPTKKPWLTLYDCSGAVEYIIHRLTPNSIVLRSDEPKQVKWIHGAIEPVNETARRQFCAFYDATRSVPNETTEAVTGESNALSVELQPKANATDMDTVEGAAILPAMPTSDQPVDEQGDRSVRCEADTAVEGDADGTASQLSPEVYDTSWAHPKFFEELDANEVFGYPNMTLNQSPPRDVTTAMALDGVLYTRSEFIQYYGFDDGEDIWQIALHVQEDIWLLAMQLNSQAHYLNLRAPEHDSYEQALRGVLCWWNKDREHGEGAYARLTRRLREPLWWRASALKRFTGDMTSAIPLTRQQCEDIWRQWRKSFNQHGLYPHQMNHTSSQKRSLHSLALNKQTGCTHVARAIIKVGARGPKSFNEIINRVYAKKQAEQLARHRREPRLGEHRDDGIQYRNACRTYKAAAACFNEARKLKLQPLEKHTDRQKQLVVQYDDGRLHRELHHAKTLHDAYKPESSNLLSNILE